MNIQSIKIMDNIPAKANPFNHDAFHMGTQLGSNLIIMHPNHSDAECPYIIICNTTTGERMKVILNEESASSSTRLANLINSISN